jgi:hypothetical protein
MELKLTMLFLLIGAIIAVSHYDDEKWVKIKYELGSLHWRNAALIMLQSMRGETKNKIALGACTKSRYPRSNCSGAAGL